MQQRWSTFSYPTLTRPVEWNVSQITLQGFAYLCMELEISELFISKYGVNYRSMVIGLELLQGSGCIVF